MQKMNIIKIWYKRINDMISNLCVITCCCLRKFFLYQTEIKIAKLGNFFKSIDGSSDDNHCVLIFIIRTFDNVSQNNFE